MRRALARISTVAAVVLAAGSVAVVQERAPSSPQPPMPRARYDRMMKDVSNWGRWGKDDQLGALNLITPAKRQQALALARSGMHVSLGRNAQTPPFELKMFIVPDNSASMPRISDRVEMDFHGGAYTHLDALCHIAYNHRTYNGYVLKDTVTTTGGCSKNSVINMKDGIVADGAGAGWDLWALPLLKERDIAVVGSDGAQEVGDNLEPPTLASEQRLRVAPVHKVIGTMMGLAILDNLDLDQAAEIAARLNRWEFMMVVAPLRVPNGTGSPVNPIGIF